MFNLGDGNIVVKSACLIMFNTEAKKWFGCVFSLPGLMMCAADVSNFCIDGSLCIASGSVKRAVNDVFCRHRFV
jgi:hypothetical protein